MDTFAINNQSGTVVFHANNPAVPISSKPVLITLHGVALAGGASTTTTLSPAIEYPDNNSALCHR